MAFPVILYGFTAHQFLFGIYSSMRLPSPQRMLGVANKVGACPAQRAPASTCPFWILLAAMMQAWCDASLDLPPGGASPHAGSRRWLA